MLKISQKLEKSYNKHRDWVQRLKTREVHNIESAYLDIYNMQRSRRANEIPKDFKKGKSRPKSGSNRADLDEDLVPDYSNLLDPRRNAKLGGMFNDDNVHVRRRQDANEWVDPYVGSNSPI